MAKTKPSVGNEPPASPIEVWLSQRNLEIGCRVIHQDESTEELDIDSLSMRGAQREITGWLIGRGYTPVGRWETEWHHEGTGEQETNRKFRIGRDEASSDR